MSFFMNNAANQSVNMQNMAMAEQELEMVSDLFNRYRDLILNCHSLSPLCLCPANCYFRVVRENFRHAWRYRCRLFHGKTLTDI